MILVEETQVPEAALPVDALKRHLRLGSGFAEDDVQDAVLGSFLRAAMASIEARCSKALITRSFVMTLNEWRDDTAQSLLIAPVSAVNEVTLVDGYGAATVIDPLRYRLEQDANGPRLKPRGATLPGIASGGAAEIRFDAGYGPDFSDLPADLAQAVMLLAAHYYEYRDETALSQGCMPFGVTSLIARYQPVRLGLGA
ncbi:head-tail connector protein [Tropicibacter oceani]|uniref:Head-tail connector protein n=1 Tax=Tropicibacter oceani TaxID=3058420 RepID=A0ABY8QD19_9RHOB|nr:head-tail connector protein [Tropicibacter oceani]WGW02512.1 head-tail connector protein [Tropicibacter oceani]